ncbi:ATP-binding protein [Actinoplanes teichomyceticus]|uniref:Anti-sigma regulatory factor (Ser/Thr protein kinase) n=1 Tax=Actinoplanes teichomyceticus TaxID=1867 RepID=A0A561VIE4_ACTTI|nr:ATP-binding protein [Actinoplanes teichomyceticus]TWG11393.1 anti-sigma regulatory factor (Ser/Thr protein kinase) [Actinoplanes teichomyceticus]GIF15795.1 hypothetical protein Ate01nite_58270 [Actinoplanes teichomyceticus]
MTDSSAVEDAAPSEAPTDPGGAVLLAQTFVAEDITVLRHALAERVAAAGLGGEPAEGFVLAVHELVTNAVRHGGGAGRLLLRRAHDTLICEVSDHGGGTARVPGDLPATDVPGGRGLWLAQRLAEDLRIEAGPTGLRASVSARLGGPAGRG